MSDDDIVKIKTVGDIRNILNNSDLKDSDQVSVVSTAPELLCPDREISAAAITDFNDGSKALIFAHIG